MPIYNNSSKINKANKKKSIICLTLISVSIVFLLNLILNIFEPFNSIILGCFGMLTYAVFLQIISVAFMIYRGKTIQLSKKKTFLICGAVFVLFLILHLATTTDIAETGFVNYLNSSYQTVYTAGGAFLTLFTGLVMMITNHLVAGFIVLSIALIIICGFLIDTLLTPALQKSKSKTKQATTEQAQPIQTKEENLYQPVQEELEDDLIYQEHLETANAKQMSEETVKAKQMSEETVKAKSILGLSKNIAPTETSTENNSEIIVSDESISKDDFMQNRPTKILHNNLGDTSSYQTKELTENEKENIKYLQDISGKYNNPTNITTSQTSKINPIISNNDDVNIYDEDVTKNNYKEMLGLNKQGDSSYNKEETSIIFDDMHTPIIVEKSNISPIVVEENDFTKFNNINIADDSFGNLSNLNGENSVRIINTQTAPQTNSTITSSTPNKYVSSSQSISTENEQSTLTPNSAAPTSNVGAMQSSNTSLHNTNLSNKSSSIDDDNAVVYEDIKYDYSSNNNNTASNNTPSMQNTRLNNANNHSFTSRDNTLVNNSGNSLNNTPKPIVPNTQPKPEVKKEEPKPKPFKKPARYIKPPFDLLKKVEIDPFDNSTSDNQAKGDALIDALNTFGIPTQINAITKGPTFTRFEMRILNGVPVRKVLGRIDDIAMVLESNGEIRAEIPIKGKNAFGIEIPNDSTTLVPLRDIVESQNFKTSASPLTFSLGKDITGECIVSKIDRLNHMLIAGSTGSGKSVCLNTLLVSLIYKSSPQDLKLILVDPKKVEFSMFNGLPHLLLPNAITEIDKAINSLDWLIDEMERRYNLFMLVNSRNLGEYNETADIKNGIKQKLPFIVFVIDELGDLMLQNKKDVEEKIIRITQKSRAAGIYLILATQRPSVDVITGTIKANLPSRIAFMTASGTDSKTILDQTGAEKLVGKGDMLFSTPDRSDCQRIQCAYISNTEVEAVVDFIKENNEADFDEEIEDQMFNKKQAAFGENVYAANEFDSLIKEALRIAVKTHKISISQLQRAFSIGFPRAAKIVDQMENNGFISAQDNKKIRTIYMTQQEFEERFGEDL